MVRIPFFTPTLGTAYSAGNTPYFLPSPTYIVKFDRRDYVGVDSIVFVASLATTSSTSFAIADVYNHTDGVVLARSEVRTNSGNIDWLESGNFFASLPAKQVTLGVRLRAEMPMLGTNLYAAHLLLYRR